MPAVLTDTALDSIWAPNEKRVHLVRRDSIRELGNGMVEAVTLCGQRVVGFLSHDPNPATCEHCLAARSR